MSNIDAARRPPIHMLENEAEALSNLALTIEDRMPQVSELLIEEISRATLHAPNDIDPKIVTMNATVEFADEATGIRRTVHLVLPRDADISAGRISILTPVGAGLIGLREGQSILWPDREGHERRLSIVRVEQPTAPLTP